MSVLRDFLPRRGSTLFYGRPAQLQSPLAMDAALSAAAHGRSVLFLTDDRREAQEIAQRVIAWRGIRALDEKVQLRVNSLPIRDVQHDAAKLIDRAAALEDKPSLIVRDLSLRMAPCAADDPWLPIAGKAAYALDACVLTIAHKGHDFSALDLTATSCNEIHLCSTFHDKARANSMNARLLKQKPLIATTPLEFFGRDNHRVIVFDETDNLEPLPRDPLDQSPKPDPLAEARTAALKAWGAEFGGVTRQ